MIIGFHFVQNEVLAGFALVFVAFRDAPEK